MLWSGEGVADSQNSLNGNFDVNFCVQLMKHFESPHTMAREFCLLGYNEQAACDRFRFSEAKMRRLAATGN